MGRNRSNRRPANRFAPRHGSSRDLGSDGSRWIACRPGFFLPVQVLSQLFRRLFLEQLQASFSGLSFFGALAPLKILPYRQRVLPSTIIAAHYSTRS
jgi:hypothetical protein